MFGNYINLYFQLSFNKINKTNSSLAYSYMGWGYSTILGVSLTTLFNIPFIRLKWITVLSKQAWNSGITLSRDELVVFILTNVCWNKALFHIILESIICYSGLQSLIQYYKALTEILNWEPVTQCYACTERSPSDLIIAWTACGGSGDDDK